MPGPWRLHYGTQREDVFLRAESCALLFFSYVAKSRAGPGEDLMLLNAKSLGDPDFANDPPLPILKLPAHMTIDVIESCRDVIES
jgi:hypothetical protein